MFRGVSLSQLRLYIALLGVFAGGWLGATYFGNRPSAGVGATVHGPAVAHSPGVLAVAPAVESAPVPAPAIAPGPAPAAATPLAPAPPTPPPVGLLPGGLIDLNAASEETLQLLPGIGPAKAADIVEDRRQRGPFARVQDLDRVSGFGPKTVERLAPHLWVGGGQAGPAAAVASGAAPDATGPALVHVNRATAEQLQQLKGVGPALAIEIMAHRQRRPIRSARDLIAVKGIGPKIVQANQEVLRYD